MMGKKYYRIRKSGYSFLIVCDTKHSECKVFSELTYINEFGKRFGKIKKFMSYNSIEDMQSDFGGFLDFIEYVEGEEIDDGNVQFEITAPDEQRGFGD